MAGYTYSGYLWPSLVLTAFIAFLSGYGWWRRKVPGGLPFALVCLFGVAWSIGSMLEHAAVGADAKIFWLRFLTVWQLPVVTGATCFILQFVGLDRWLTRRKALLLSLPPIALALVIATDPLHHLFWTALPLVGDTIQQVRGPGLWVGLGYSYLLSLANLGLLVWAFVRSPRLRGPVALMLVGQIAARALFEVGSRTGLAVGWDRDPVLLGVVFGLYAIALFGFHVFNPVPVARAAALGQMAEGMLVLDVRGRIVDANRAAERMFGEPSGSLRGRLVGTLLPEAAGLVAAGSGRGAAEAELMLENGATSRHYRAEATTLTDKQGQELGRLLLLHDVSEQKRAQARLVEQERVVATLEERERLARELHDSIGQVLAYVSVQAQTVQKWLRDGDSQKAEPLLARLTEVAQQAHADVRESILALRAAPAGEWSFLAALRRYVEDFRNQYGVGTELVVDESVTEDTFQPGAAVQLLRVIQEALTNARKHGEGSAVRIVMEQQDGWVSITVKDDGRGFDTAAQTAHPGRHFGLGFMRERMAQIGGSVAIESQPGRGTSVNLQVPARNEEERG